MAISRFNQENMSGCSFHPTPKSSGQTELHGHEDYWERYGSELGADILHLHHGLESVCPWKRQIPALVELGYNVLVYDRWGYRRSASRPVFEIYFLHHETEEAIDLLERLAIQQASFIGHGDQGSIAILIASQYPQVVNCLILVAAHIDIETNLAKGLEWIKMASEEPPFSTASKREYGFRATEPDPTWLDGWIAHDPRINKRMHEWTEFLCAAVVIHGEKDKCAPPQHAKDIATGIEKASLWLIPEVGHMPIQKIPIDFNQRMVQFPEEKLVHLSCPEGARTEWEVVQ
jgi:pimeloyl-ACP methyl ester carboxylesterase